MDPAIERTETEREDERRRLVLAGAAAVHRLRVQVEKVARLAALLALEGALRAAAAQAERERSTTH